MVAISDGHCKLLKPIIAWPLVQPPAYLVPKPTKKPPIINNRKPLTDNNACQLNNSEGNNFEVSVILYVFNSDNNFGFTCIAFEQVK